MDTTVYRFFLFNYCFLSLVSTRWGYDKFPKETPLVFYKSGQPIQPPLEMLDGLKVVLENMVAHIEKQFPRTLKFWRLQSPRHFHGGEWNQNGSCVFSEPLDESQVCYGSILVSYLNDSLFLLVHFNLMSP